MTYTLVLMLEWLVGFMVVYMMHRYIFHPFVLTRYDNRPTLSDRKYGMNLYVQTATLLLIGFLYGVLLWFILNWIPESEKLLAFIWLTSSYWLSVTDLIDYYVPGLVLYPGHVLLAVWHMWHGLPVHWLSLLFIVPLIGFVWRQTLGGGDLLLLLGWAPWLNMRELALLLLFASFLGMVVFTLYNKLSSRKLVRLPFIPFLTIGLLLVRFIFYE